MKVYAFAITFGIKEIMILLVFIIILKCFYYVIFFFYLCRHMAEIIISVSEPSSIGIIDLKQLIAQLSFNLG